MERPANRQMVGATGIEPVTPTMSTDVTTPKTLEKLSHFSRGGRHSPGTAGEHEGFGAQTARNHEYRSDARSVSISAAISAQAGTFAEARRIQDLLLHLLGQIAGIKKIKVTVRAAD